MNTVLSLFDYSGNWPRPFAYDGWRVIQVDEKLGIDILDIDSAETALDLFENVHGILAAPPCTTWTRTSAQYWPRYDRNGQTDHALSLVDRVEALAELFKPTDPDYYAELGEPFFWAVENPPGRLPKAKPSLLPRQHEPIPPETDHRMNPRDPFYFDPCDYAGYLDLSDSDHNELDRIRRKGGKGITREEVLFVMECNAYTKKTVLYGEFRTPRQKRPIEPVRCNPQGSPVQSFGGNSSQGKEIRSRTPLGFAKAFFLANRDYQAPLTQPKQKRLF